MSDYEKASFLDSDLKIDYTISEINTIASMVLSSLTDEGEFDFETGLKMKLFLNTILEMTVTRKEECDEILKEVADWEKENIPALADGFDILAAAQNISNNTKYES